MTDNLVKRLREGDEFEKTMSADQAADRIEELEAKLAEARKEGMLAASAIANRTTPPTTDFISVWGEYEHGVDDAQKAIAAAIRAEAEGET